MDKRGLSRACHSHDQENNRAVLGRQVGSILRNVQSCQLCRCLVDLHFVCAGLGRVIVCLNRLLVLSLHLYHFEVS